MSNDSATAYFRYSGNTSSDGTAYYSAGDKSSDLQVLICLIQDISGYLNSIKRMGTDFYDISRESVAIIESWETLNRQKPSRKFPDMIDEEACEKLSFLSLHGYGAFGARLFFIICNKKISNKNTGDLTPTSIYQGDTGELFLKILNAMKLGKELVYTSCITMPDLPGYEKEISMDMDECIGFIKRQIEYVCPEIICCLGDIAVKAFLGNDYPLSVSRGRFYNYKGIKVMPTFHPASLLMDPSKKKYVWDDMQKIMALLGI